MNTKDILTFLTVVVSYFALNMAFGAEIAIVEGVKKTPISRDAFVNGPEGDKDYNAADKKPMFHEPENPLVENKNRIPTASPSKRDPHESFNVKDVELHSESAKQMKSKGFEPVEYDFEEAVDPLI